jgi:choline dehydrogenase-like flavoprotein
MYVRGHAADYDDWAKLGNEGWDFKSLLPYFTKHEHFDEPSQYTSPSNIPLETKYDAEFHGKNGPIHTSFSTWRYPGEREWIAASSKLGDKMGSPTNAWSGDHLGTYHSLSTIDRSNGPANGTRSYATTGYLLPNAGRPNLHVLVEALVSKVIITEDGTAKGVEFIHSDKIHTVNVKKEVIVSAGAIKSPQVLELSGIGNPNILEKAGVKCIIPNLRVGENLTDHPATGFGYELVEGEKSLDMLQDPAVVQAAMEEYMTTKSGPLSSGGAAIGFASYADLASREEVEALTKSIVTTQEPVTSLDRQAMKVIADGLADPNDGSIQFVLVPATLNLSRADDQTAMLAPPEGQLGKHGILLAVCLARPLSAGSCHITTADHKDDPAIDPAYLSHPADIDVLQKGLQLVERVASTSPLKEKIKKRYDPESIDVNDRKQVEDYLKGHTGTEYHPIGSVAMGPKGTGACDSRLRVHGCKGLRVVDASIMPIHVSGNIVGTVYAIAEKASDMIKEDWGLAH